MIGIPILQYQTIEPVLYDDLSYRVGNIKTHLSLLRSEGFNTISCRDLDAGLNKIHDLPEKPLLITFDNGLRSYYEFVANALIENYLTATFFIAGECALKSSCKQKDYFDRYMDVDQLRKMTSYGFELGVHPFGYSDPDQPSLTDLKADIDNSMLFLNRFSIPYSKIVAFTRKWKSLRSTNYKALSFLLKQSGVFLSFQESGSRYSLSVNNCYRLNRINVSEDMSDTALLRILTRNQTSRLF